MNGPAREPSLDAHRWLWVGEKPLVGKANEQRRLAHPRIAWLTLSTNRGRETRTGLRTGDDKLEHVVPGNSGHVNEKAGIGIITLRSSLVVVVVAVEVCCGTAARARLPPLFRFEFTATVFLNSTMTANWRNVFTYVAFFCCGTCSDNRFQLQQIFSDLRKSAPPVVERIFPRRGREAGSDDDEVSGLGGWQEQSGGASLLSSPYQSYGSLTTFP